MLLSIFLFSCRFIGNIGFARDIVQPIYMSTPPKKGSFLDCNSEKVPHT